MESGKIRDSYLKFFKDKGHAVVSGSGLVPFDDATLLFTNAGMVQFKKFWATESALPYSKAVTCQKCIRAGGKDSDFDKIGISARHHTFFEMLGNFSFGDYFKKEAVGWAYEFVVDVLKLDGEKIWASYYNEDKETRDIWKKFLPASRIIPLGKEDNFWGPAGDTGPCGPCTELYMDLGKEKSCGADCLPGCDCERFLEFWNLVFPQYDRQSDGSFAPLKRRGVDTGMGLERTARIMQGALSNYETDLFLPIIQMVEEISGCTYGSAADSSKVFFRRISDHIRAIVFLIDANILPSNEGRGYVLRRIIRRAAVSGSYLGIKEPFLYKASEAPVKIMQGVYPTLKENKNLISRVLHEEEERFLSILDSASKNFHEFLGEVVGKNKMPGTAAFKLYDTYGVPKDVIDELAFQNSIIVDWEEFDKALEKQKKASRFSTETGLQKKTLHERLPLSPTLFTGYQSTEGAGKAMAIYMDEKKGLFYLVFDRSPFYPEKGGQVGDRGLIEGTDAVFAVYDTKIDEKGLIFHIGKFKQGSPKDLWNGGEIALKVDGEFREKVSANHTATHLLHYALRKIFGKEIRQAGSYVAEDRLRFDFVCFENLSENHIANAEKIVQDAILGKDPVSVVEMPVEEALKTDAVALFAEKYEDVVRIIKIGGYHSEICGGTHIENTADILIFRITGFSSIGKNLKRIEAVTYRTAIDYLDGYRDVVREISGRFETPPEKLLQRIDKFFNENREKEKIIKQYEDAVASMAGSALISKKDVICVDGCGYNYISGKFNLGNSNIVSKIADNLTASLDNCIAFIADEQKDKLLFVIKVGEEIKNRYPAVKLAGEVSGILGGGGGGNDVFARGSGANKGKFQEATGRIKDIIQGKGAKK